MLEVASLLNYREAAVFDSGVQIPRYCVFFANQLKAHEARGLAEIAAFTPGMSFFGAWFSPQL